MVGSVYSLSGSPGQARERKEHRREQEFDEVTVKFLRRSCSSVGRTRVSWAGVFMCAEVLGILGEVNEIPNQPQTGVSKANTVWDPCNFHKRVHLLQGSHTAPAPYTKSIQRSSGAAQTVNDTPLYPVPATLNPTPAGPRSCGAAQTLNDTPFYALPVAVHPKPAGPHSCGAAQTLNDTPFVRSPGCRAP